MSGMNTSVCATFIFPLRRQLKTPSFGFEATSSLTVTQLWRDWLDLESCEHNVIPPADYSDRKAAISPDAYLQAWLGLTWRPAAKGSSDAHMELLLMPALDNNQVSKSACLHSNKYQLLVLRGGFPFITSNRAARPCSRCSSNRANP